MRVRVLAFALMAIAACETTTGNPQATSAAASAPVVAGDARESGASLTPATNIVPPESAFAAGDYWTPEKMKNAIPADVVTKPEAPSPAAGMEASEAAPGMSRAVPGSLPPPGPEAAASGPQRAGNEHPFGAAGKLFFRKGGTDYVCSAQFVGANIILTAAHCVIGENGAWVQNTVFQRGYANGQVLESFYPKCQAAFTNVALGNTYKFSIDYAFIKTTAQSRSWLGLQTNTGSNSWTAIGYPSNYSSGLYLLRVPGHRGSSGSVVEMVGNVFGPGSSGGAWIDGLYGPNYVVGLNSFTYDGRPNMWSPLFDTEFWRLFQYAQTAC